MQLLPWLILAYLIGSFSPGYFFGKIVKGIDIRKYGNHNTGATNTYRVVGPAFGIFAGAIDVLKPPLVYVLSALSFGFEWAILVGLFAVLGQVFPFYLRFRGGRGMASLFGLSFAMLFFTRSVFALLLVVFTVGEIVAFKIFISKSIVFEAGGRKILKLSALLFPLGMIYLPKDLVVLVVGGFLGISLVFDLLRFTKKNVGISYLKLHFFAKKKELGKFSGYTVFLTSAFFVLLIFPKEISVLVMAIFILGDTLAPIGRTVLPIPLIGKKTLGGAGIVFLISAVTGIFLDSLTPLSLSLQIIFLAALLTTLLDQLSFLIDDNLLVPIGTSAGLWFFS